VTDFSRRSLLASTLAFAACSQSSLNRNFSSEIFICPPCGCSEDQTEFDAPGRCPDCDMTLMPKHESELSFEPNKLCARAGVFTISGGLGRENKLVSVHYYLPDDFSPYSKVLLIVPGAGRNSPAYRNAWIDTARKNNILVAALGYPEKDYDLAAYNMGGVIENFRAQNIVTSTPGVIRAQDEDILFDINEDRTKWLFSDFDRIFEFLKLATGSMAAKYDIFGHSAGGQVLHRMTLFYPMSKVNRIIAANSGWYTLPDLTTALPVGLSGTPIQENELHDSFSLKLTILLGEYDDNDSAGGTLLHTPLIDKQGLGRFSRGQNFFKVGQEMAHKMNTAFNWRLKTVPNVGHDFRDMSLAATEIILT
jgi:pimeloyl-ACP methyl ester carboxylesterase